MMMHTETPTPLLWRRHDIERLLHIPRSTLYYWMSEDRFPAPVQLSVRSVGWHDADIRKWLDSRQNAVNQG